MALPGQGADLPHLIQHLKNKFVEHCQTHQLGHVNRMSAEEFWDFAADYLAKHRTVENWPADRNIGIRLSDNNRVLVHPATKAGSGEMQDSGSIAVTEGLTQPGQEGVDSTAAKHVT